MRKLAILSIAFAFVAVSFYGCEQTSPIEPEYQTKANAPAFDKGGNGVGVEFGPNTSLGLTFNTSDGSYCRFATLEYSDHNDFYRVNPDGTTSWHAVFDEVLLTVRVEGVEYSGTGRASVRAANVDFTLHQAQPPLTAHAVGVATNGSTTLRAMCQMAMNANWVRTVERVRLW